MELSKIKQNFKNQLTTTKEKYIDLKEELQKTEEYKFKLIGAIEALELIEEEQNNIVE